MRPQFCAQMDELLSRCSLVDIAMKWSLGLGHDGTAAPTPRGSLEYCKIFGSIQFLVVVPSHLTSPSRVSKLAKHLDQRQNI